MYTDGVSRRSPKIVLRWFEMPGKVCLENHRTELVSARMLQACLEDHRRYVELAYDVKPKVCLENHRFELRSNAIGVSRRPPETC